MKQLLKKTFQNKYSSPDFEGFTAKLFQKSSGDFMSQKIFKNSEEEKYSDSRLLLSLGTDDNKKIEVLSIELKTKSNVENARSYQRGLIEKYIKQRIDSGNWVDGVLVSFWNAQENSWRLSFVQMEMKDGKKEFTPPKRFSFLVGEGESTHTAEQQFLEILEKKHTPLFSQLLEAFSVEKVTNEFFDLYKRHFLALNEQFLNNETFQKEVVERQGLKNADFVKKLMGQVVFLYFLQKKGWMGVKKGEKWGSGDKNFMRNILDECLSGKGADKERGGKNFFNDYLEHLFYDTLNNKDRGGASVTGDYSWTEYFQCRIPYLNGGLFEPNYSWKNTFIDIPNESFKSLFDTFDRFNFTVYEADSLEKDVAVDPEMLGKVFENLLEIDERKGKGAFYTPREIVHYMCQESLINYLTNSSGYEEERIRKLMNRKDEITAKSDAERKAIEGNKELKIMAEKIDTLLQKVTVCDPAVGSGAFPMGMLKEIVSLRFFLNRIFLDTKLTEYDIKKQTLEHCIYGVDIEKGAIEICRLRFWLSMVVEHDIEEVEPLPNLDYKLMQGNSLLEDLVIGDSVIKLNVGSQNKGDKRTKEMKNLFQEEEKMALFSMDKTNEIVDKLQKLHTEFFATTEPKQKKIMKSKIDKYENTLIQTACSDEVLRLREVVSNERNKGTEAKAVKAEEQIQMIEDTLIKWEKDHIRPFFPWKLHFGEIFKDGGFDIVIGNPPYIQLQKNSGVLANMYQNCGLESFVRSGDIYCLFYEFGNKILNEKGNLSFITSNKWMRAGYGEKMRKYFAENTTPKLLIDLGPGVFETATVDTNILQFEKGKREESCFSCNVKENLQKKQIPLKGYIEKNGINSQYNTSESWTILNPLEQKIKEKIEKIGTQLKDWDIKINRGVLTGYNEAFIIDGKKKDELIKQDPKSAEIIKPILRGKDIKRYSSDFADMWLIASHNGYTNNKGEKIEAVNIENYPAIKEWLDSHWEKISKRGDKGKTPYNLRNCAYQEEFEKEKIVYSEIVKKPQFHFDVNQFFPEATSFLMTGKNLKYIVSILNSKAFTYFFSRFYAGGGLGDTGYRYKKKFLELTPIPKILLEEQKPFIEKVEQILEKTSQENYDSKNISEEQKTLEKEIDEMVFDLYGLSEEERRVVLGE